MPESGSPKHEPRLTTLADGTALAHPLFRGV